MIPDLLPYHSYDPDGSLFVQRDGSLALAWALEPPECECLPPEALGRLARRVEALLAVFPEGAAAQFILESTRRVDLSPWLDATTEGGLLRDLAESRAAATRASEIPHEGATVAARRLTLRMTLRSFPAWHAPTIGEGLRFSLQGARTIEDRFRRAYAREKGSLLDRARALESLLEQAGIGCRRLGLEEGLAWIHAWLNPGRPAPAPRDAGDAPLHERLAFTELACDGDGLRIGAQPVRVLTAREVPRETWTGMLPLGGLLEGAVVFNLEVCPAEQVRKFLAAKKRLAFCQMSGGDDKVDVGAMKQEVDAVTAEIFTEGARVYGARLHVLSAGPTDGVINAFARAGLQLVEERALAPSLFLQALPMAYDPANDRALRRGRKLLGLNLAHLLPFYGALRGTRTPDLLLLNRLGEPVTFSFFDSPVAPHGIIAGVSGAGKSVLANTLILSAARRGARVYVLDRGNSYRKLCEMLGGTYVAFDPLRPRSINPCGRGLDEDKKLFLTDIVCEMASQGRREATVKERSLVTRAVIRSFADAGDREVLLRDLLAALRADPEPEARDLAVCLEPFAGDGPYAGFFDRPAGAEPPGALTVFELGEVAKRKDVASVILMALLHRITDACRSRPDLQKYLIVDEAWTLLRSETTAGFLEDVLRTYRKLNASAIMVTQQVSDFEGRTGEAIRANAPSRLFLQQTGETVLAMERLLDLSAEEKAALAALRTVKGRFSEILVQSTETRGLARLVPDPLGYWITTTDPRDNLRLERLVLEKGGLREALLEAARG
jgi:hypothetical protein